MGDQKKRQRTKQEVMDGITAYQEKLKQRRATKVTPESLQQALDDRKAARAEKAARREPGERAKRIKLAGAVALLVATAVVALGISSANKSFEAESAANQEKIADLQTDLRSVEPTGTPVERTKNLESQLDKARARAGEVAELQQEFASLMRKASTDKTEGNGRPSKSFLTSVEHRRELAPYFAPESYVVDGEAAYRPNSTDTFDEDQIDPRYPWYVRYEPDADQPTAAPASTYSWSVASVGVPESGDEENFKVVWLCEDEETGDLLAWASAQYEIASQKFDVLSVGTTTVGDKYAAEARRGE